MGSLVCLSQSTSKWQIITCRCQEGLTTTTTPMWSLFWTSLNASQSRYHHTLNISVVSATFVNHFIVD